MAFAARTSPFTITEPQVLLHASARTTGLATRIEPVNLDDGSTVPLGFVLQLTDQFVPATVGYRSCETMVLHHVLRGERFHADDLVLVNQLSGRLVQMVHPHVLNLLVDSRQLATKFHYPLGLLICCLVPPVAQFPLDFLDLPLHRAVRLHVGILDTIAVNYQRLDTEINSYHLVGLRQCLDLLLHHQRAVVLSRLVLGDRAVRYVLFDFPVNYALDAFLELRDGQFAVHQLDVLWYTEGLLVVLGLELRELRPALKEVVVRRLQVLDSLLQGLAVYFGQPRQGLLEFGQVFAVFEVSVALAVVEVLLLSLGEEVVVEVAGAAKVLGEQYSLFSGRL